MCQQNQLTIKTNKNNNQRGKPQLKAWRVPVIIIKTMSALGMIGAAAVSAGGSILAAKYNNVQAIAREREARDENFQYNEKAAENADARTRALYNDLYSPAAQMQQIKDAGLSPSIYANGGMAGKSGTSGAQAAGANGVSPTVYGADPINAAIAAAQLGKVKAETDNIKADTANKEGTGAQGKADIAAKLAQAGLAEASKAYTEAQTTYQELVNTITSETGMRKAIAEVKQIDMQTYKAFQEARQAGWQVDFNKLTQQLQIDQLTNQNALLVAQKLTQESNIQLNEAQKTYLSEQIKNWQIQNGLKYLEIETQDTHNRNTESIQEEQNKISWERLWQENNLKLKELGLAEEQIRVLEQNAKRSAWLNFATDMGNIAVRATALAMTRGASEMGQTQNTYKPKYNGSTTEQGTWAEYNYVGL